MSRPRTFHRIAALLVVGLVAACGGDGDGDDAEPASSDALVGLFAVAPGTCAGGAASGSTFRMVQPGGTVADGPFVANADSTCDDTTWTLLEPGADGGLRTGDYQPQPEPAFAADGSSASTAVIAPAAFFAVGFGLSTNEADPQTGEAVPAPTIVVADDVMSGDLSALSVSWNGQHFNQGAPKPGVDPDADSVRGTYEPDTRTYTLDWSSRIEGGPFDGFTGIWHLEGTFTPS